jgi:hypothetical protein
LIYFIINNFGREQPTMDQKRSLQIISYGWDDKTQAEKFAQSAKIDAELSLLTPATNTPGFVYKNKLESSKVIIQQNGIKYDAIIILVVSNCLDWMNKSISEQLIKSHYFRPVSCSFINHLQYKYMNE